MWTLAKSLILLGALCGRRLWLMRTERHWAVKAPRLQVPSGAPFRQNGGMATSPVIRVLKRKRAVISGEPHKAEAR